MDPLSNGADVTRPWDPQDDREPADHRDATDGRTLGARYRLGELIGRGGTATVHRAWDELLHRNVAVKIFDDHPSVDAGQRARRLVEMQALAAVDHPGLVAVYDATVADATDSAASTFLVMELVPGSTVAARVARGPVPDPTVRTWGRTLAGALVDVHRAGLVHRDVKPANVLIDAGDNVKLGDFGLARIVAADARITSGADVLGTPAYLSPEQATGEAVGPPSDVYSLGLVLLECLTGRREYPGEAVSSALGRLLRSPAVPGDLPAPWPALLTAMTARDPALRPTAAGVVDALTSGAGHGVPLAGGGRGTGPTTLDALMQNPAGNGRRRTGLRILATSTLVAAGAAAVIGIVIGQRDPDASTPPATAPISTPSESPGASAGSAEASIAPASPAGTSAVVEPAQSTSATEVPATTSAPRTTRTTAAAPVTPVATAPPSVAEPATNAVSEPVASSTSSAASTSTPTSAPAPTSAPTSTATTSATATETTSATPLTTEPPVTDPAGDGNGNGNGGGNGGGNGNGGGAHGGASGPATVR